MTELIRAVGGPLDGMDVPCRFPKGLVLGHPEGGGALVYDRHADRIVARELDDLDEEKILDAGLGEDYDVLAYDEKTMGAWQR